MKFAIILKDLWNQSNGREGGFILSDKGKELSIAKETDIIFNPFQLSLNNRKILTSLYQGLIQESQESLQMETIRLRATVLDYLDQVVQRSEYPLTYDDEIGMGEIFKAYCLRIDESSNDLAEAILQYLRISKRILDTKLFFFVNLKQYLTKEIIIFLYESLFYEKIFILDIESSQKYFLDYEKTTLIDNDKCIITI